MKPEEFNAKVEEILTNLSDQGKVSTILAELKEDYGKEIAKQVEALTNAEKLKTDNEKLREANMNLFLKIGSDKSIESGKTQQTEEEDKVLTFENLFDENGNLK